MSDIIYLQLSLPADKIKAYSIGYAEGRLPPFRYEVKLSGSLTYIQDKFGRWVYLRESAYAYGETIDQAVTKALAELDDLFASELARQNAAEPYAPLGISTQSEVNELASLLGL